MAKKFRGRLDILPPAQRHLWGELAAVPVYFALYGGTALALHLGHRQSEDFDFFADRNIDPAELYRTTPFLRGSQITQQEPNTLTCLVDRGGPVKISFFGLPHLARIREPAIAESNGLKIASLLDIAGTKAAVVQQRAQARDYVDIDALIVQGGVDLPTQLAAARAIYGPHFVGQRQPAGAGKSATDETFAPHASAPQRRQAHRLVQAPRGGPRQPRGAARLRHEACHR